MHAVAHSTPTPTAVTGKPPLPPPPAAASTSAGEAPTTTTSSKPKYPPGFKPFRQPANNKYNRRGGPDGPSPGPVRWLRLAEGSAMTEAGFQEAVANLRVRWPPRVVSVRACVGKVAQHTHVPLELSHQALIREGQEAAQALAALESLQAQAIPPPTIYDEVFGCCAASGEWAQALQVLEHAATVAGEKPTLATYQSALDAIVQGMRKAGAGEKGQGAERAVAVYEAMVAGGVTPDGRAVEGVLLALKQVSVWMLRHARFGLVG